ncbi:TIR domain-containing protein [Chitinophaga varians]|uniref:TIR domain-containing protein n=1 Tax=Chitinophaga varians TaxID=2202339 RepID=UPI00165F87EB|nr:TIR domain-containing protein [Chitinophaga varians]MBC9911043.1 TIR domain-containing protein [Chitinophaga varians]
MSGETKRRHLFISHFHQDDGEVTKLTKLLNGHGFDIRNSSIRAKPENQKRLDEKKVSDETIKRLLKIKISWAGTVVVLIGKDTHTRPWVNWEIKKAHEQGKRIVGVYVQGGSEADIPENLTNYGDAIVKWNTNSIMAAIDGENNFEKPDGSPREPLKAPTSTC